MPATTPPPIATITPSTDLARRVVGLLAQLRQCRDQAAGLDRDLAEMFALLQFDPTNPSPESVAAVAVRLGMQADQVPAALTGLAGLRLLDFSGPLARFAGPGY